METVIPCGWLALEDNIRTLFYSNPTITSLGLFYWDEEAAIPFLTMLGRDEETDVGVSTVAESDSGLQDGHGEAKPNPTLDFLPSLQFLSFTEPSIEPSNQAFLLTSRQQSAVGDHNCV